MRPDNQPLVDHDADHVAECGEQKEKLRHEFGENSDHVAAAHVVGRLQAPVVFNSVQ